MRRTAACVAVALALPGAALLAGCGGGQTAVNVEGVGVNSELRLADCTDWERADTQERLTTMAQLKDFSGGQADTPIGRGPVLDDKQGYDLIDNYCKNDYARAFKLYKIYERAAAFEGH